MEPLTFVGKTEPLKTAHCQSPSLFQMSILQFCRHRSSGGHNSFTAERIPLRNQGGRRMKGSFNVVQQWSSHVHHCEKVAIHKSLTFLKGLQIVGSSRQGLRRPVVNVADDSEATTHFFYEEFIEAVSIVKLKLSGPVISKDPFHPGLTEEKGTSQRKEDAGSEKPPETNCESSSFTWDVPQDLEASRPGRMPIESNGPPMVILQPYLVSDNSQERLKEKLRQLPLPMPHKMRPIGLPRPSLRRRLGVGYSRKYMCGGQEGKPVSRDPAVDI